MKYYLIVGEASGDLHASNLMRALIQEDPGSRIPFLWRGLDDGCWWNAGEALQRTGLYGFYPGVVAFAYYLSEYERM